MLENFRLAAPPGSGQESCHNIAILDRRNPEGMIRAELKAARKGWRKHPARWNFY
jgi:hypothetical protein